MSEKKVLIFGTGQFAQIIKRYLEEQGRVLVVGFVLYVLLWVGVGWGGGGYTPSRQ